MKQKMLTRGARSCAQGMLTGCAKHNHCRHHGISRCVDFRHCCYVAFRTAAVPGEVEPFRGVSSANVRKK